MPRYAAPNTYPETAARRDGGSARGQRRGGAARAQPDRARLVGLLLQRGVHRDVPVTGPLRVETHLQVGRLPSPGQVEALDRQPVLRPAPPDQADGCSATRDSGAYLLRFAWTKIVRRDLVKGSASPDDPALAEYWAKRRQRKTAEPPIGRADLRLLKAQQGRCVICRGLLLHADDQPRSPDEWEQWLKVTRKAITKQAIAYTGCGPPDEEELRLAHTSCQRRHATDNRPALLPAREPLGLA